MIENKTTLINKLGLHARAASEFVKVAQKFGCEVVVKKDDIQANGKSIISMMMLEASVGTSILLQCDGEDEREALDSLVNLIKNRFGENE